jgi:4-aminobutyrate aminotransferase-like enzyme
LGEGGYVSAPPAFLQGIRKICDQHGILLIVDEVQTGFGRTGKYFNIEYSGVRPDIMTMAKVGFLKLPNCLFLNCSDKGFGKRLPFELYS